jgi:lipopolysaccharide transport system ATP-binding protein
MSDIAIRVEGLGKRYRIGGKQERYKMLRETLTDTITAPIRGLSSLAHRGHGPNGKGAPKHEEIWALKDVSFEVKAGEALGIIGRNGAGKSTLLKILSRITEPTEGVVDIYGRVASLLEVGTGFHQELTGRENVLLNGAILGMKRAEIDRRFDEIVAFAEVEKFIDTPVKHYSSGMYLRLAFAVAAHLEPEILLVDEVLAVGDAMFQQKCLGKMGEVAQEGRTVLFVSHNMGAIANLCASCIHIEEGKLTDIGGTDSVMTAYLARMNSDIPDQGLADLRHKQRSASLDGRKAQFIQVRMLNLGRQQMATFLEREPFEIEACFEVSESISNVQLGCSVFKLNPNVELFTVPSQIYSSKLPIGCYCIRLPINPNYLRDGTYTLALKLFANGTRQDTVGETIRFDISRYVPPDAESAYFARWVAGPLWLPYEWQGIQAADSSLLG